MIGQSILHYKILQKLGEGGMGVVYLAEDTKLERKVAIKFLPHYITANYEEKERFKIEAKAAAALNHPNIATIYSIEETSDDIFIVMEYIDGIELKDKIKSNQISLNEIVSIAIQTAEGLDVAQKQGIIHRDIKPQNIMISKDGLAKIMDFGLAKVSGSKPVTKMDSTVGTISYMSPEQTRGDKVDHRTDIWSFGVVLYEMLTGELPFKGDYDQAILYSILNEDITLNLPDKKEYEGLGQIVKKSLDKEKDNRYGSFKEIITELKSIKNKLNLSGLNLISKNIFRKKIILIPAAIVIGLLTLLLIRFVQNYNEKIYARQEILPKIQKLAYESSWTGEGSNTWKAFILANKIQQIIPDDPVLENLYKKITRKVSILSSQEDIKVSVKPYSSSLQWKVLGRTPIDSVSLPIGFSQLKFEKNGFSAGFDLIWIDSFIKEYSVTFKLKEQNKIPEGMVYVPNEATWVDVNAGNAKLHLPGLENVKYFPVGDFFIDRKEVSNKKYKEFIDAGGYKNPAYWKYPFILNGKKLTWKEAMKKFIDKTERPGPSTWEISDYPDGADDLPVSGISWYEAAAYSEFKGKSLPTVYHWDRVAFIWASSVIIPNSNFGTNGPVSTIDSNSISRFGVYNLAGNVREWCFNENVKNSNFILGGGWNDPGYAFIDYYLQSPFDRSKTNGFRCIKYVEGTVNKNMLEERIKLPKKNYLKDKPVPDGRFAGIIDQYAYDKTSLKSKIIEQKEFKDYIRQKVSFNAAYNGERMSGYLFIPKKIKPPFQIVIYFPGSHVMHQRSSKNIELNNFMDFFVKSGRALFYPIYKSTYERGDKVKSDYPDASNVYKDHVIMWTKDVCRSIDYLETRDEINLNKIAYYGMSWGAVMGGIIPAVEKRIKIVILIVAGLDNVRVLPEAKTINFLPRILQPVLMLNGKYDFYFPYESSQRPFFRLLGTEEKKMITYEGGHTVPYIELVKESLSWLDKYLGKVEAD